MGLQGGDGIRAQAARRQAGGFRRAGEETCGQRRDILAALFQRGHAQRHHGQAVIEILAEMPGGDFARQVLGRRGEHADIDLHARAGTAADALKTLVLQHARDLALGFHRHFGNLVQQQRAAMGALQHADAARGGMGIGPGLDAEQFRLEALRRQDGAVQRHERAIGAAGLGVDHAAPRSPCRSPARR